MVVITMAFSVGVGCSCESPCVGALMPLDFSYYLDDVWSFIQLFDCFLFSTFFALCAGGRSPASLPATASHFQSNYLFQGHRRSHSGVFVATTLLLAFTKFSLFLFAVVLSVFVVVVFFVCVCFRLFLFVCFLSASTSLICLGCSWLFFVPLSCLFFITVAVCSPYIVVSSPYIFHSLSFGTYLTFGPF